MTRLLRWLTRWLRRTPARRAVVPRLTRQQAPDPWSWALLSRDELRRWDADLERRRGAEVRPRGIDVPPDWLR